MQTMTYDAMNTLNPAATTANALAASECAASECVASVGTASECVASGCAASECVASKCVASGRAASASGAECGTLLCALRQIRAATLELRMMQEEYHAIQPSPQAPRLDGMPRGGSAADAADGVARMIDARSLLAERIAHHGEALARRLDQVRPRLDALPTHLFTFSLHYYVNATPIAEVARTMRRDKKTLYDYKKRLAQYM